MVIDHQLGFRVFGLALMHDLLRITAVDLRTGHPDMFAGKLHRFDDNRLFGPCRQTHCNAATLLELRDIESFIDRVRSVLAGAEGYRGNTPLG